jgi:hypothetical protein
MLPRMLLHARVTLRTLSMEFMASNCSTHSGHPVATGLRPVPGLSRRQWIGRAGLATVGWLGLSGFRATAEVLRESLKFFQGQGVFDRIVTRAAAGNWASLPIGERMGKIALELKGTPYVGFTLEVSPDHEFCVADLNGLDCVTFFEDCLCLARMLKRGGNSPMQFLSELRLTRYRGGNLGDFTSRLHYTTDWFVDNQKKGVVKILTPELPGAQPFTQKVGIMSQHPENYRQLAAHSELVEKIREIEGQINSRSLTYLPMARIEETEKLLQTGDIVGVTTTAPGIDIAHTGLCIKDDQGIVHFMDASSSPRRMCVTLEPELSKCLNWSSRLTGIMVARPLEAEAANR